MKKFSLGLLVAILLVTSFSLAYTIFAKERKGAPEFVPQLGEKDLQKVVFIRYAPDYHKAKACDYDGVCESEEGENPSCADCKKDSDDPEEPTNSCYTFLAGPKPKWNWTEPVTSTSASNMLTVSEWATSMWDAQTTATIFGDVIEGDYPWGNYDYVNSITLGNYPEEGVLGVTAIWYQGKNIYEYDIMLDTDYFPTGSYDLETVLLHEFGHAAGLGDLYDSVCVDELMYYQLGADEIKFLGEGDIIGIQTLYGN